MLRLSAGTSYALTDAASLIEVLQTGVWHWHCGAVQPRIKAHAAANSACFAAMAARPIHHHWMALRAAVGRPKPPGRLRR
jgi:hypothetical protein